MRKDRWQWGALATVFALGALLGWRQISSPDIGFHLSTARWMIVNHAWPVSDLFSFTFTGHRYIDLQWLFQLTLYGANQIGGAAMMMTLKIIVTLAFWALLVFRARRMAGYIPWSAALLLIVVGLGDYWEERPQLFSWLYGSLILLVLEEFSRGNRRWLPALPAIMLLWVNTHQLFVLGLVSIGVYALWELRRGAKADRRLLVCAALSVTACLLNPYHVDGLLLPVRLFGEIQSGDVFAFASSGISEMEPPFRASLYYPAGRFVLFQPPLYWHLYTLLALIGLIAAWRTARVPELVLWAGFAFVFSQAHKNFGYFVMATFPLAAAGLDRIVSAAFRQSRARVGAWLSWAAIGLCVVLAGLVMSGRLYKLSWSDFKTRPGFDSWYLPVEAAGFLRDQHIQGNVLTTFGNGSYIHWITGLPVSIYGIQEVMGPEFYRDYLSSLTPQGFPGFLSKWRPTVVVASMVEGPYWVLYLSAQPDWRLVHVTNKTAVFLHRSVTGPPALPPARAGIDYRSHARDDMKRVIGEASARPDMTFAAWLQGNAAIDQPAILLSTRYLYTGQFDASVNTGIDAIAASPIRVMEQLLIVGTALNAMRDYELADLAFAGVLRANPDQQTRQQIENAVRARALR